MARRRKRKSRRRLEGRRILEQVAHYNIETGEDKPVTAARKYIRAQGIVPPALLLVKRNEHTTDRYFWAEKGLFGAQYVEENHFLFPSLKEAEQQAQIVASAAKKAQSAVRLSGSTELTPNVAHAEAQNPPIAAHSQ